MGKHRSRLGILANILSVISENGGAKKTQIMYQAYLSYKLLLQYLKDLTEAKLVVCKSEKYYALTPKGEQFLARFVEYNESRAKVDEQLTHVDDQRSLLEKMCPNKEP
jgi:predicted transcriptional regulator